MLLKLKRYNIKIYINNNYDDGPRSFRIERER